MGFVPKPARQVGAAPLPEPSQPTPARGGIVLSHYRKTPPSPALWGRAMSVGVLRGAAPNGNSKYWSSGRRRCGDYAAYSPHLVRRIAVVRLFAGDAVAVTIKVIDVYADNTNWASDILRAVSSTPGAINIARIRDAPGVIAVAP